MILIKTVSKDSYCDRKTNNFTKPKYRESIKQLFSSTILSMMPEYLGARFLPYNTDATQCSLLSLDVLQLCFGIRLFRQQL